ncbi:hypothetical protein RND71_014575 [Anisodus tanguticus]|uniref:Uncharacterized protein n=1 Tax=Anisodus tanguticus TaxID=243964 RepID=A0AAE1SBH0_9SOLA|nr:hypothetical protein RND71_014575 [Anisodus tanguticus]
MISFFETLRVELGTQFGITIVSPGLIESELTKGKFLTVEGKLKVDQVIRDEYNEIILATSKGGGKV